MLRGRAGQARPHAAGPAPTAAPCSPAPLPHCRQVAAQKLGLNVAAMVCLQILGGAAGQMVSISNILGECIVWAVEGVVGGGLAMVFKMRVRLGPRAQRGA